MSSPRIIYTFHLRDAVPLEEAQAILDVAVLCVQSLHGEAVTRLEAHYAVDEEHRTVAIDAGCEPGKALARLFVGDMLREFGNNSVHVTTTERPAAEWVIRAKSVSTN